MDDQNTLLELYKLEGATALEIATQALPIMISSTSEAVSIKCYEMLKNSLASLDLSIFNNYLSQASSCLSSPNVQLVRLGIDLVQNAIKRNIDVDDILQIDQSIITNLARCLSLDDGKIASKASLTLFNLLNGAQIYTHINSVALEFHLLLKANKSVAFRAMEFLSRLASQSVSIYNLLNKHGLVFHLKDLPDDGDILAALNTVELYILICEDVEAHGKSVLEHSGVLPKLLSKLEQPEDDVFQSLLKCAIIKFWGFFFQGKIAVAKSADVLQALTNCMQESDEVQNAVVCAVARIGSSVPGLVILSETPLLTDAVMHRTRYSVGDTKTICLKTVAVLLDKNPSPDIDIESITKSIFKSMGTAILNISYQPNQ